MELGYSLIPKMLHRLEIFVIFPCKNLSLDSAREKSHWLAYVSWKVFIDFRSVFKPFSLIKFLHACKICVLHGDCKGYLKEGLQWLIGRLWKLPPLAMVSDMQFNSIKEEEVNVIKNNSLLTRCFLGGICLSHLSKK